MHITRCFLRSRGITDAIRDYFSCGVMLSQRMAPFLLRTESVGRTEQEQAYQIAVRLTRVEHERIQEMIRAGLFRSAADFAMEAVRDKLREAEPLSVRDIPGKEIE